MTTKRTPTVAVQGSTTPAPTDATTAQTPAPPEPAATHPRDEYTGLGGVYVRDPVTGVRTPLPTDTDAAA